MVRALQGYEHWCMLQRRMHAACMVHACHMHCRHSEPVNTCVVTYAHFHHCQTCQSACAMRAQLGGGGGSLNTNVIAANAWQRDKWQFWWKHTRLDLSKGAHGATETSSCGRTCPSILLEVRRGHALFKCVQSWLEVVCIPEKWLPTHFMIHQSHASSKQLRAEEFAAHAMACAPLLARCDMVLNCL
jgi:hypothetical protein